MNCYLVAIRPDEPKDGATGLEDVGAKVENLFGQEHVYPFHDGIWIVASEIDGCHDLGQKLGLYPESDGYVTGRTSVITRLNDYNGFAPRALWEKLSKWERLP